MEGNSGALSNYSLVGSPDSSLQITSTEEPAPRSLINLFDQDDPEKNNSENDNTNKDSDSSKSTSTPVTSTTANMVVNFDSNLEHFVKEFLKIVLTHQIAYA